MLSWIMASYKRVIYHSMCKCEGPNIFHLQTCAFDTKFSVEKNLLSHIIYLPVLTGLLITNFFEG